MRHVDRDGVRALQRSDPRRIGRYTLDGVLGRGGEAIVYRAHSSRTGSVALKVPRTDGATAAHEYSCRREYDLAHQVAPRYTMAPLDTGTSPVGPYLVSTYRYGYRPLVVSRPLPPQRLWRVAYRTSLALAAVHALGIIHCDVKPANLLALDDDVRLIDFGSARFVDAQPSRTSLVHCSRGWSAPEQLLAAPLTPAADVFGWGCVIGYLAAGVGPFASETLQGWMLRVRSAEPDLSGLPDGLDELVHLAVRREPSRRPSAAYLAAACRQVIVATSPSTAAYGPDMWVSAA
jgi:serine/threonine protein kinase